MDDDHSALGVEQLDVVYHLGAPAVHVENGPPHQVVVEEQPALLIDKGRIPSAAVRPVDENRVILNLDHLVPRNELVGLPATMFDVKAGGVRVGFSEAENEVGDLPDLPVVLARRKSGGKPQLQRGGRSGG